MTDEQGREFSPPYNIPWATFLNTVERAANDLPNVIDRSYLESQAGSIQTYIIAALKGFDLIDENLRPTGLKRFAEQPDGRPALVAEMLERHYGPMLKLGQTKATSGELDKSFGEHFPRVTGESRKKAIRFFLAAANYAEVQISPLWKVPKAGPSTRRGSRTKSSRQQQVDPPPARQPGTAHSADGMKSLYFDLLLTKAKESDGDATEYLDRIEKLLGTAETGSPELPAQEADALSTAEGKAGVDSS